MANAKKLPSGSWRVLAYLGKDPTGKPIRVSFTAETKKEAEFQAAEYIAFSIFKCFSRFWVKIPHFVHTVYTKVHTTAHACQPFRRII